MMQYPQIISLVNERCHQRQLYQSKMYVIPVTRHHIQINDFVTRHSDVVLGYVLVSTLHYLNVELLATKMADILVSLEPASTPGYYTRWQRIKRAVIPGQKKRDQRRIRRVQRKIEGIAIE